VAVVSSMGRSTWQQKRAGLAAGDGGKARRFFAGLGNNAAAGSARFRCGEAGGRKITAAAREGNMLQRRVQKSGL